MSLNPWFVLLLGILIGWILEWLFELLFFRRRRLEAQRQLASAEAQLQVRDEELRQAQARIASFEAEQAAGPGAITTAEGQIEAPEAGESGSGLGIAGLAAAGLAGAALAKASSGEPEIAAPEVEAAEVTDETPIMEDEVQKTDDSKSGLGVAGLAAAGLAGAALAQATSDQSEAAAQPSTETAELPKVALTAAAVDAALPRADLEAEPPEAALPSAELGAPYVRAELPAIAIAASAMAADLPKAELETPPLELGGQPADAGVSGVAVAAGAVAAGVAGVVAGKKLAEESEAAEVVAPETAAGAEAAASVEKELEAGEGAAEVATGVPGAAVAAGIAAGVAAAALTEKEPDAGEGAAEAAVVAAGAPALAAKDDLTLIRGIGPKFAGQLAAAGITTFAALAASTPEQLQETVNAPTWQKPDYAGWIAEAKVWDKQRGKAGDDLLIIEGIGPVYAAKLRAAGITTFAQLAEADDARLAEIIQAPAWRKVNYADWREQARLAAAGDAAGLRALQDKLFARSEKDNLGLIAGVGEKTGAALAAAGIVSYAALADSSPEELDKTVKLAGLRAGDYEAWIAEAKLRAAGERVVRAKKPEPCPQDLSRVEGVGAAYETKLYEAGIGTYWQLSILTHDELTYILGVQEFQKVDLAGIKADALRLAQETNTLERTWDGTPPDDFELVEGIGATYEGRLYDAGICTYEALAAATSERLAAICKAPEFATPDYAAWIAQAARFVGKRSRGVKHLAACPEDLSKIKGIGSVYETKLYEAGIGSYWELAQTDEAELRRILEIKEFQKVDLAAFKADAQRLAEETLTVGRGWTGTAPDDFEELEGVGAVYEGRLYAAGICTFKTLSNATVEQLTEICKAPAFRTPDYAGWIAQAKVLVAQRGR
jgi:predicted flap endonuclease-1-like 5' DNA nuclease